MISPEEIVAAVLLSVWVIFTVKVLTKALYSRMRSWGIKHETAVYYNRKFIHIVAGGVSTVAVPLFFRTPYLPLAMAMLITAYILILHRRGRIMYWFQKEGSFNEVSFCVMWGLIMALGWVVSGNLWFGAVPVLFMSIGDAVTGISRILVHGGRTKSWWGNLIMAAFSMSIGAMLGAAGILAGGAASLFEHFEFRLLDDNVIVSLVPFLILVAAWIYAPWTLHL